MFMMYEDALKNVVLDVLTDRASSTINSIKTLFENGYIPNKSKYAKIGIINQLFNQYYNNVVVNENTKINLDNLFNKLITTWVN